MSSKLEFKLVIEKKSQKVLFAEVRKNVVDFLLSLFVLPMGSVINLITKDSSISSLGNMYSSWDKLDEKFLHSNKMKANRLIPAIASLSSTPESSNFAHVLSSASPATIVEQLYRCNNYVFTGSMPNNPSKCQSNYFTDVQCTACKTCHKGMNLGCDYIGPNVTKEEVKRHGYVRGDVTYAVMDDLLMVPLTASLDSISLLNKMNHTNLSQLEQKIVVLDVQAEGLELLKTSLRSENVLTDVFLAKKKDGLQKEGK